MAQKKKSAAEEEAAKLRGRLMGNTGLGRLQRALDAKPSEKADYASGRKNAKGIQTMTEEEAKKVRHRLELKYYNTYPGGGKR